MPRFSLNPSNTTMLAEFQRFKGQPLLETSIFPGLLGLHIFHNRGSPELLAPLWEGYTWYPPIASYPASLMWNSFQKHWSPFSEQLEYLLPNSSFWLSMNSDMPFFLPLGGFDYNHRLTHYLHHWLLQPTHRAAISLNVMNDQQHQRTNQPWVQWKVRLLPEAQWNPRSLLAVGCRCCSDWSHQAWEPGRPGVISSLCPCEFRQVMLLWPQAHHP